MHALITHVLNGLASAPSLSWFGADLPIISGVAAIVNSPTAQHPGVISQSA